MLYECLRVLISWHFADHVLKKKKNYINLMMVKMIKNIKENEDRGEDEDRGDEDREEWIHDKEKI